MPTLTVPPPRPYDKYVNPDGTLTTQGYDFLYGLYLRVGGSLSSLNAVTLTDKTWDAPNPIGTTTPNTGKFTTFGANGATPQAAAASGVALVAYAAGANGLANGADMQALVNKVIAMDAALKANGILS
jgi:hypothetical protein